MLQVKQGAKPLVRLIIDHARQGDVDPLIVSTLMPEYSVHHVAFVIEQLSQLPYPDLTHLIKGG